MAPTPATTMAPRPVRTKAPSRKQKDINDEHERLAAAKVQPKPPTHQERAIAQRVNVATAGSIISQNVTLVRKTVVPRATNKGTTPVPRLNTLAKPPQPVAPTRPVTTGTQPRAPNRREETQMISSQSIQITHEEEEVDDGQPIRAEGAEPRNDLFNFDVDPNKDSGLPQEDNETDTEVDAEANAEVDAEADTEVDEAGVDLNSEAKANINTSRKRGYTEDEDDELELIDDAPAQKVQKVHEHQGRARMKDFDITAKEIITVAQDLYEIKVLAITAFPTIRQQESWAHEVWQEACNRCGIQLRVTPEIIKMLLRRATHFRSEFKKNSRNAVQDGYRFSDSMSDKAKKYNALLAHTLLISTTHGFVFPDRELRKPPAERQAMYRHPAIGKLLTKTCFRNRQDLGVQYEDVIGDHIPPPTIAFLCTMLEYAINEWSTARFKKAFQSHDLLHKIGEKLLLNARQHASVGPLNSTDGDLAGVPSQEVFDAMAAAYGNGYESEADYDEPSETDGQLLAAVQELERAASLN